ncbi:MAG: OmpH family outer membrane protein [Alphaproteobacteria bacterium]|nr:OmpH family outer membrane protein [Alphaproteobacteria bacterium]
MNTEKFLRFTLTIFALLIFSSLQANAEVSIAVVDIHQILSESKAAKSVKEQVKSKRESFVKEVKSAEDVLRKEQKKLEEAKDKVSKEELMSQFRSFEERRLEARKNLQEKQKNLDQAYNKVMADLSKSIFEVCQKIADEKKIDLVITKDNIIVGNKALDITAEVLANLDKTLPKLALDVK